MKNVINALVETFGECLICAFLISIPIGFAFLAVYHPFCAIGLLVFVLFTVTFEENYNRNKGNSR